MKNLVDFICESAMKTVNSQDDIDLDKYNNMCITYIGDDQKNVADVFKKHYGVTSYFVKNDYTLVIPCTKEIEKDFCNNEEDAQDICVTLGLNLEEFEW